MIKSVLLLLLFVLSAALSFSQTNVPTPKICRIAGGAGIGAATQNTTSVGRNTWLQLSYTLLQNVSVATEFDNLGYKLPSFFKNLPSDLDEINVLDNSFSLLLKYHFPIRSALKIAVASGWAYGIVQSEYYVLETDSSSQHIYKDQSSYTDYRIPLLLEIEYPILKNINVQVRAKYNVNSQNGSTYTAGIGLSLKL